MLRRRAREGAADDDGAAAVDGGVVDQPQRRGEELPRRVVGEAPLGHGPGPAGVDDDRVRPVLVTIGAAAHRAEYARNEVS